MNFSRFFYLGCVCVGLLASVACRSASKSLSKGDYDTAIEKCIKVLQKEPTNADHLEILRTAYQLGTLYDEERIITLKTRGEPAFWGDLVDAYQRIKNRDDKILRLPASVQSAMEFQPKNIEEDLLVAKRKAAEYYYAKGVQLMNPDDRFACREAYNNFVRASKYFPEYKDLNELKALAREGGFTHVLLLLENRSGKYLDPNCKFNLLQNAKPSYLQNKSWTVVHYEGVPEDFHYVYTFVLQHFSFSPVKNSVNTRTESKVIDDGWEYKTDSKGKPVLDSAGAFIKVPKKKTISCILTESKLLKSVALEGDLQLVEMPSQRWVTTHRMRCEENAVSIQYSLSGNKKALSEESLRKIQMPVNPLPPDRVLLEEACGRMGVNIASRMDAQSYLIK